jgi:hypothetical protein
MCTIRLIKEGLDFVGQPRSSRRRFRQRMTHSTTTALSSADHAAVDKEATTNINHVYEGCTAIDV